MMKLIYPLLILIGVVLGIYWLVKKYRPTMAQRPNHLKKVIIGTAVFVIGLFGLAGCKKDRKPVVTCYSPQAVEKIQKNAAVSPYPVASLEKARANIVMRLNTLSSLYEKGVIPAEVYQETVKQLHWDARNIYTTQGGEKLSLSEIEAAFSKLVQAFEKSKPNLKAEATEYEKEMLRIRQSLNSAYIVKMEKEPAWKTLQKQWWQLRSLLNKQKNEFNMKEVEKALEGLKTAKALNEFTAKMLRLMFGQSAFHNEMLTADCYKPIDINSLESKKRPRREIVMTILKEFQNEAYSGDKALVMIEKIGRAVKCLDSAKVSDCDNAVKLTLNDKLSVTQAIHVFLALNKR